MTAPSASSAKEIGKPELGSDPRFARNKDRIANRDALRAELAAVFSQHDAGPLCDRLLAAGLPAGPVQRIDQALTSAHTVHRGDVIEKDWYKGVASPIRLERSKPSLRRVAAEFQPARDRGADASSDIPRARSTPWSPRAWSAAPSASAEVASSRRTQDAAPRIPCRDGNCLPQQPRPVAYGLSGVARSGRLDDPAPVSAYFPLSLARASPIPSFRLYGHLHVIQRCYRAKRR